ncbi:PfkB family carbohydrate kinase [Enemella evansiae]|uniref:PfkB family carbohydrate kinase n=1 Tax=Enemella evansiae TaxID=2016499 RepID=UPI000B977966|nr:PfkB family carbohydrate kinase [Enemella evansiae]OYO00085.1 carbohydrate kinase [Enemella evansiae]OYO03222.1 carbohydrate kinase [Enemella evansiae]OYO09202.1 carbohydrate kinase [Enemella evansiae]PFG65926.1 fructokinase [Propionibacteriaceae bacterium ES.041]
MTRIRLLSVGEALIDVVDQHGRTSEHVGGSLLNVGCGLGRLGHDSTIQTWIARDERGERIRDWVSAAGASLAEGSEEAERTPVAYATLDLHGHADYTFDLEWRLPKPPADDYQHLHTGSFACTLEPGGSQVVAAVLKLREQGTVSYDPNIRPALMESAEAVQPRIEELIGLADVVKASDEDIEWLYGDVPLEEVIAGWRERGPSLVVITRGPWGALAALASEPEVLKLDQLPVTVADTVGAGDSFMAGLISGLVDAGFIGSRAAADRLAAAGWADVQPALQRAIVTAAITVSRAGAYGPDRDEVQAAQATAPAAE